MATAEKKQAEQRIKQRAALTQRVQSGDLTPDEKVDLYIRGEFFFPDVFEFRGPLDVAKKTLHERGIVEKDGRIWYVDPGFAASKQRVLERSQKRKRRKG